MKERWKALAEIYTMHSFAPFLESKFEKSGKKKLAKTTLEKVKMRGHQAAARYLVLQRKGAAEKKSRD